MECHFLDTDVNHIGGLCIRPSVISGVGLFTVVRLEQHQAIGIWTGESVDGDVWKDDHYGCEMAYCEDCIVLTPLVNGVVDYIRHPFAAMNEPCVGETAQIVSVVQEYDCDDGSVSLMIVFYTARRVLSGEELTWHYGSNYDRAYEVGQKARVEGLENRPNYNRLHRMLKHRPDGVHSIVCTSEKDDSQDPEYRPNSRKK